MGTVARQPFQACPASVSLCTRKSRSSPWLSVPRGFSIPWGDVFKTQAAEPPLEM